MRLINSYVIIWLKFLEILVLFGRSYISFYFSVFNVQPLSPLCINHTGSPQRPSMCNVVDGSSSSSKQVENRKLMCKCEDFRKCCYMAKKGADVSGSVASGSSFHRQIDMTCLEYAVDLPDEFKRVYSKKLLDIILSFFLLQRNYKVCSEFFCISRNYSLTSSTSYI